MPDYINANGIPYTEEEVNAAAQRDGISVDDVLSKNGLTLPDTPDPAEVDEPQPNVEEPIGWGESLKQSFTNDLVMPFVEKVASTSNIFFDNPEEEKQRTSAPKFISEKEDFSKELEKAFGDNPTLFGQIIENPSEMSIEDREKRAGDFGSPEEYLLDIIKEKVGGMGWLNEKTELGESRYGSLNQDDIDALVEEKFNVELSQYKENKANNFALDKARSVEDASEWSDKNRSTLVNGYAGVDKDIALLVESLNHGNLNEVQRAEVYKKLNEIKTSEERSMLLNQITGELVVARGDRKDDDGLVDLGISDKQKEINSTLELIKPENQLDYLKNEFERSAFTYAGHKDYLNQKVQVEVALPASNEEGFQGDPTVLRGVSLRQILTEELGNNWVTKAIKGLTLENRFDSNVLEKITTPDGRVLTERKDIEDFIQILGQNELEYTREYEALKSMYLLNDGIVDLEKPSFTLFGVVATNMSAIQQSAKSLVKPWSGDYYADKMIGTTDREKIFATDEVYNNLGIKKTKEEQAQVEQHWKEMVNDGILGSNKMLVEFAGINKGLAAVGIAGRFAKLMQTLQGGKYIKNGKSFTKAAINARAKAAGVEASTYAANLGLREIPSMLNRGLAVGANGLMEGAKFELFTQFDVTKMQLKPEAGEQFGFATGFGFGAAGRLLTPLSPLLSKKGLLKDIDANLLKYVPTAREARIGLNSRKLFETFVTQPASFVAGSEFGEVVDALSDDMLGNGSYKNFIDEHYGHMDEVGKRLLTNYFVGLGFGAGHFKGFADFKSKAALERMYSRERDIMVNEFGELAKLNVNEKNNIFSKESQQKLRKNLSSENYDRFMKHYEVYEMAYNRRQAAVRAEGYMDPARAEEMVKQDHKDLIASEKAAGKTLRFEVVNNRRLKMGQKEMTDKAQIIDAPDGKGKIIRYNADFYTPDVLAHEVHHYYTEDLLGRDAVFKSEFMNTLNSVASKVKLTRLVNEVEAKFLQDPARAGKKMTLSESIKLEKFDLTSTRENTKISQWELFAHIAEQIGNKNNYLDIKSSEGFVELKGLLSTIAKPTGKKLNLSKEADVVRWFTEYAKNVKKGKSVIELFSELETVIDKDATKITQQERLLSEPGSLELSSKDLNLQKAELIEKNKELAKNKPDGYIELAKANAEKVKAINENIRISEANEKNIKIFKERESGDPSRTRAENNLLKDNQPIIETWFRKNFKKGLDVSESDFRGSMNEQVAKIFNSYNDLNVPFGYYLKSRLAPQLGNILRRAQAGRTTEIAMSEVGVDAETLNIADVPSGGGGEAPASGPKRQKVVLSEKFNAPEDVINKIKDNVESIDIEKANYKNLKGQATEFINKLFGVTPKPGNLNSGSVRNAQEFIKNNAQTIIDLLPEGAVPMEGAPESVKGTATGVQNVLLKAFYNKAEGRAKTKAGLSPWNKGRITEQQLFDFIGIKPDGTFVELKNDRGLSQKVKSIVEQADRAMTNQITREQLEAVEASREVVNQIGAGKSSVLASKVLDNYMERFPESKFEEVQKAFYNAYINNKSELTKEQVKYFKNIKLENGLMNREQALVYGYMDAKAMAGKTKRVRFDKELIQAEISDVKLSSGETITASEIKGLDLSANFKTKKGDVIVDVPRTNRFVNHSVEFSKLLPKEISKNLSFFDQILFLHQRTTFEKEGRSVKKSGGKIIGANGEVVAGQPFTNGRKRSLDVLGENTLTDIWDGIKFDFKKATTQVAGQKKYAEAKSEAERIDIIEKYFDQLGEKSKAKMYNAIASTMEAYVHGGKNKAEVLSRMEWAANAMRSNSNLRLGLRQTAPILAIYKGAGKMTDAKYKLEHAKASVKQSATAFELIAQNKWRQYGPETLKDFVGILSPKKLLDIIDVKGGTTNMEALYRMAILEPSTLKDFVTVESKGKQNLLDYILNKGRLELGGKAIKEAMAQKKILDINVKSVQDLIGKKYNPKSKVLNSKDLNKIDKALIEGRKKNKEARGMSTFDFDDTLATTKSGIRYEMPNPSGKPQPGRKAILIAGNAGAGKTTVVEQLGLRKQGFKYINQDIALDWLTKNNGLPKDMNSFTREQSQKWRDLQGEAAVSAKNKASKLRGQGDGVVIDGTGAVGVQFEGMARKFKDAGYDVQVVFVESSLETALARNKGRSERKLTDATVRNSVEAAQKNKKAFQDMAKFFPYSAKGFVEINTSKLKQGEPLPAEFVKTMDNFTKGYIKGRINAEQFAAEGAKLLEQGAKYDFSEFNKVVEGAPGPLLGKAIERAKKFGNENMFVLTARPAESAGPIREFLKSQGLDIPLKNITGLGNSTGEAKAMWMLEKFSEGYNDMYFVDDAMQNVKAVKNVLKQLDIKSSVQQALSSKNLDVEINQIMENSLDIKSNKKFSKAEAAVRGKDIKRRRVFMTDSAADMELLLEPLYGKGKKGIENKKWFEENFTRTWERGINDFNNARQAITNDYMNLRKQNKDVVKKLSIPVEGTNFTTDMAIRTYIWNKAGYKIPDLTPTSQAKLVKHVIDNPNLRSYAEKVARLTRIEGGLKEPSAQWWGETLATEIQDLGKGIGRKKYIQEFIDAKNEIFSEENLNKMESKLGTNWRNNIEEMFSRMETGRTRSLDLGKTGNAMMNYFNGSTGAIMNFNTRSASLQLISTVNFVNHSFNNPLAAAKAFADQPQYWKDFMTIMNSDMLKQRRAGLEINVTEAELAAAAASSKNPAKAVIAKILKAGYLPTKVADSFAIASGGATYYRNAIKMYEKQGLSKIEAERKAFIDFQAIAERTQQSSRADLLSNQQTSFAGRVILPFANTSMQMNRIMVKEVLDISKGRYKGYYGEGSLTNKLSKIGYYGFAQSAIFAGLQSGAFALMTNSDDEKLVADAKLRSLNTMADSFLRGMGIQGAVLNGFRLAIKEFIKQDAKKYNADYSEIGEKLLNISPTVGSKFSKLDQAGNTYNYNKKVIKNEGLTLNGPLMETSTQVIEATTNLPLNRYYRKGNNVLNALDDDYENWQRILMGLGWSNWGLGVGDPKVVNKGKENEFTKYRTKEDLRREQQDKEIREFEKSKKNGITNNAWGGGW